MPDAGRTPWPACNKKSRRQSPQVQPEQPAFPARWFYGLYRALPGEPGFVATIVRNHLANLTPASGRQDHTTSPSAVSLARPAKPPRPSHPAAHVRDDREASLLSAAGRGKNA